MSSKKAKFQAFIPNGATKYVAAFCKKMRGGRYAVTFVEFPIWTVVEINGKGAQPCPLIYTDADMYEPATDIEGYVRPCEDPETEAEEKSMSRQIIKEFKKNENPDLDNDDDDDDEEDPDLDNDDEEDPDDDDEEDPDDPDDDEPNVIRSR